MGRVKSEDLKQELLEAALELFKVEGFEKTSIKAIVDHVNASKGAFYHYFKSKEDILESITQQYIDALLVIPEKIANDDDLNGLEKMNRLFFELLNLKKENRVKRLAIIEAFETEGNLKLRQKIIESTILNIKRPYQKIIEQGIQEGIFVNGYPAEVAELLVQMIFTMNSNIAKLLRDDHHRSEGMDGVKRKVCFYEDAMERLLGLTKGSFQFSEIIMKRLSLVYAKD